MNDFSRDNGFFEIQHTADIAFEIFGRNLEELFKQACNAMYAYLDIKHSNDWKKTECLQIQENDYESLLVSFLEEILLRIEKGIYSRISELNIKNIELTGHIAHFDLISAEHEIKAITFHQLAISREMGYKTRIVFDV